MYCCQQWREQFVLANRSNINLLMHNVNQGCRLILHLFVIFSRLVWRAVSTEGSKIEPKWQPSRNYANGCMFMHVAFWSSPHSLRGCSITAMELSGGVYGTVNDVGTLHLLACWTSCTPTAYTNYTPADMWRLLEQNFVTCLLSKKVSRWTQAQSLKYQQQFVQKASCGLLLLIVLHTNRGIW
jgi:hypothetical protein